MHPDFPALVERVHALGRASVAPHAAAVDRDARFPAEAFAALKAEKLLSAYVPAHLGGMGLSLTEVAKLGELLGLYCANTAMVFAMHQIQVACIVHHALGSETFRAFCRELSEKQLLLGSATTEVGVGGDVRTSLCAVDVQGDRYHVEKHAPVISYAIDCDAIMTTCRRHATAGPNDQVHILVRKEHCTLEPLMSWDTMGFRGTCSLGFILRGDGPADHILPAPYAEIHAKTMAPVAHLTWSALWLGMATDAVRVARAHVRAQARKSPGVLPPTAFRLAEVDSVLFSMRSGVEAVLHDYEARLVTYAGQPFPQDFAWAVRVNNLKVSSSKLCVEVVGGAMSICGIEAYRNDSPASLCRHLRDAYGTTLMVHNDRILGQASSMQVMMRDA